MNKSNKTNSLRESHLSVYNIVIFYFLFFRIANVQELINVVMQQHVNYIHLLNVLLVHVVTIVRLVFCLFFWKNQSIYSPYNFKIYYTELINSTQINLFLISKNLIMEGPEKRLPLNKKIIHIPFII